MFKRLLMTTLLLPTIVCGAENALTDTTPYNFSLGEFVEVRYISCGTLAEAFNSECKPQTYSLALLPASVVKRTTKAIHFCGNLSSGSSTVLVNHFSKHNVYLIIAGYLMI